MKILIVNGSPKGKYSVTLQTLNYLALKFPEHDFKVIHAGQQIKKIQRDFSSSKKALEEADLILFSYPVYTFIAPCQLHYFIDLMKENKVDVAGKFATQITTSKHFWDITAHRYIEDNCQDMGMKFIKGLSADMDDLTTEKGQKEALEFFKYILWSKENDHSEPIIPAASAKVLSKVTVPEVPSAKQKRDIVIVADIKDEDSQLSQMIERFKAVMPMNTKVVNIAEYPFKGGCLGCFNCAVDGTCVYKDGFDAFLRNEIQSADAIVYAFTIKDHSMGPLFKMYDDRQFCNGHRTVTMGMPVAYLVSGEYSKEMNLRMILEGRAEVGGNFLAGIGSDEFDADKSIDRMADMLTYALKNKYVQPANFYGVGGMKIFRDLIYVMQGMMKADHKFYKSHGQYDFPQKHKGRLVAMYLVGALLSSEKIKSKMGNKMTEGMLMPYKKIMDNAKKSSGVVIANDADIISDALKAEKETVKA
jgi:multimeric flavodoxin WrbA